ncbi:MAG: hypothetical protein JRJ75_13105 [Deltaproteobacteria bacterium]|nr:hypothetical protein [Deltaproteobacteria bacterium]MBW1930279.1 hypothetical protein [Deltaproteobacteria bacterium]
MMVKVANFTRHYPRQAEIRYWRERGYCLDPTPRAPSLDESWGEIEIAEILSEEMEKIKAQGFKAILVGGLTNVMAYAWYIAQGMGLEVLYARGRKGENGYIITAHSAMLKPSLLAA